MRMRKKTWAAPFLEAHPELAINDPKNYKGKWKEYLNCQSLHVEIGCGKGDYCTQMSVKEEHSGWIGIERERNVAAVAVKKAVEMESKRLCFIVQDAGQLSEWFEEKEIDVIHLNFSDPWPKSGYKKRRLSHRGFIEQYKQCLAEQGRVIMKTDNSTLFEFSLLEFADCGWKLAEVSVDFRRKEHPEDALTEYEKRFLELGQPIYRAIWQKNG